VSSCCRSAYNNCIDTCSARTLEDSKEIKPHLAEPVFAAGISNRLDSHIVMRFLATLAKRVKFKVSLRLGVHFRVLTGILKPVTSNRVIQNLVQHELFYAATRPPNTPSTPPLLRDAIVDLVSSLFAMNPTNASQPSHIIPLAKIYTGTLSSSDLQLRSVFEQFEAHRSLSTAPLFAHWSPNHTGSPNTLLDALTSLDPAFTMKTCTTFSSTAICDHIGTVSDTRIYDPRFLISLLSGVLANADSMNHVDWVNIFRTNVVSVAFRALAAREDDLRELAAQALFVLGHSLKVRSLNGTSRLLERQLSSQRLIGCGFPRTRGSSACSQDGS
jgi:nucleolar pre-ribosomal-associated protein 1